MPKKSLPDHIVIVVCSGCLTAGCWHGCVKTDCRGYDPIGLSVQQLRHLQREPEKIWEHAEEAQDYRAAEQVRLAGNEKIKPKLRFMILCRDGFCCCYCGAAAPKTELHVDHIRSRKDGGPTEPHNLVTACRDCNLGKSSMSVSVKPAVSRGYTFEKSERDAAFENNRARLEKTDTKAVMDALYKKFGVIAIPSVWLAPRLVLREKDGLSVQ